MGMHIIISIIGRYSHWWLCTEVQSAAIQYVVTSTFTNSLCAAFGAICRYVRMHLVALNRTRVSKHMGPYVLSSIVKSTILKYAHI